MTETTQQPELPIPTCFISYSWDSEDHKAWVCQLATALRSKGIDARIDQWEAQLGMDLSKYMEERIRSSDYVLLVCTPCFAERANTGKGGVGYEKGVITGEIYYGAQQTKFIPILRTGSVKKSLPSYLLNKLFVDFRDDFDFNDGILAIVRHIYRKPEHALPPLGNPNVLMETGYDPSRKDSTKISFFSVLEYACINYPGLDVTPEHIREIVCNLEQLGYRTIEEIDMSIRPVRHIAREVECWTCRQYACDQITIALALTNPEYFDLLGPHQAKHTKWLRENRQKLPSDQEGWL